MTGQVVLLTIEQGAARSRLTTFFRLILVIPHAILLGLWGLGAFFASVAAWFAIVFTGRYPQGLWDFCAGWVRYNARVNLYTYLAVDQFPPFSGGPDDYAVQLEVPRLPEYNRLKTALRIFYIIPAYLVAVIVSYVIYLVGFVDWLVIVITGSQPPALQSAMVAMTGWLIRLAGLGTLVTESYGLEARAVPAAVTFAA
jgi:hypothetical protein